MFNLENEAKLPFRHTHYEISNNKAKPKKIVNEDRSFDDIYNTTKVIGADKTGKYIDIKR